MKRLIVNAGIVLGCALVLPLVVLIGLCVTEKSDAPIWTAYFPLILFSLDAMISF